MTTVNFNAVVLPSYVNASFETTGVNEKISFTTDRFVWSLLDNLPSIGMLPISISIITDLVQQIL